MKQTLVLALFILLSIVTISGYQEKVTASPKFTSKVGKTLVDVVKNSSIVTVSKMEKNSDGKYYVVEEGRVLSHDQLMQLKRLLLSDDHYIFDRQKKSLFIPKLTFNFNGKGVVKVSTTGQQVKFELPNKTVVLDYDPMGDEFTTFCQSLREVAS